MSLLAVFYTSHYQWLNCKKTSWSIHIEVNYCFICWYTLHSQLNSTEILLVFINHLIKFSIEKGNVYSNTRTSYPCGICHTNCDGLKGVACDSCKHWFQIVKTCPSLISYFYQIDFPKVLFHTRKGSRGWNQILQRTLLWLNIYLGNFSRSCHPWKFKEKKRICKNNLSCHEELAFVNAITLVFPESTHLLCKRHLYQNTKQKLIDDCVDKADRQKKNLGMIFNEDELIDAHDSVFLIQNRKNREGF